MYVGFRASLKHYGSRQGADQFLRPYSKVEAAARTVSSVSLGGG